MSWNESSQLVFGNSFLEPLDYGRRVTVILQVAQVIRVQRSDTAYNLAKRGAFDGVNFAIGMLPESLDSGHKHSIFGSAAVLSLFDLFRFPHKKGVSS